jgi:hypothetical protein
MKHAKFDELSIAELVECYVNMAVEEDKGEQESEYIAIYDVKTGKAGLTPARVTELLTETRAEPTTTKVIELRFGRAIVQYVLASSAWSYVQP